MPHRTKTKIFFFLTALAVAAAGYLWFRPAQEKFNSGISVQTSTYSNSVYHFSLTLPDGYTATEVQSDEGSTVEIQNNSGDGIQILITPFDEDVRTLTAERIIHDIPGITVENTKPVTVAPGYAGVSFASNNAAFGGDSREIWFVYGGRLYQVTTYARLGTQLDALFDTWHFTQ